MYLTEKDLVEQFLNKLTAAELWDNSNFFTEFNYSRGKTDIVVISHENTVIAIEAKLSNWKYALQQAYRNLCFADKSYILLPIEIALRVKEFEYEFKKRGVGLCSIEDEQIIILKEAEHNQPLQPWLKQNVLQRILGE